MCTFGISTDEEGRVLRRDGTSVPGLFATGNAAATSEFRGYVTGYANSRNFAMAYAAMNAAAG
jgi:3-oxosteroid 1-dehydrogenase